MPLSKPKNRQLLHTRKIHCLGYLRDDGMIEIEASLHDSKPYEFSNHDRGGTIAAGEALHGLTLRIAVDRELQIVEAEAAMDFTPFNYCREIKTAYAKLVGMRIGPGMRKEVNRRVGGVQGCTHINEMLPQVATTVFQTLYSVQYQLDDSAGQGRADKDKERSNFWINSCHTHAASSPVTRQISPEHYKAPSDEA